MDNCQRKGAGYRIISTSRRVLLRAMPPLALVIVLAANGAQAQIATQAAPYGSPSGTPSALDLSPDPSTADASPQVAPVPALQLFGAIDLGETYTTDAGGEVGLPTASPDEYTRAMLQLGLRYTTRESQIIANYSLIGDYYARFHNLNEYLNYLNLAGRVKLIPDHLILNVTGFATPTLLNRVGAISAGGELVGSSNNSNTYGYMIQPQYLMRFKDFASFTTTVSQGGLYFVSPTSVSTAGAVPTPVQNASSIDVSERLGSGEYFGRLMWSLTGIYDQLKQQSFSETQKNIVANLGYAIDRTFSILATGGYSNLSATVPLGRGLSGPEALGGFTFTPSPSFNLTAEGGVRNQVPTYIGSLHWNIGPLTTLDGLLTDAITTPQGNILANLSGFGGSLLSPTLGTGAVSPISLLGQSLGPQLGITSPINSQGLAIDNSIYHDRMATVTLTRTVETMSYSLAFYDDTRKQINVVAGLNPNTSLYGATASISRQMWPDLTGFASASYSFADEFGGHDQIFSATAGLTYTVSDTFSLYALDRYLHRDINAGAINSPLSDEEVVIGIRRAF